jgi:hypothetical protein
MEKEYNRYEILNNTTTIQIMPMVKLPVNSTDKFEYWNSEIHRFDKLAYKYYGNPFYDFLLIYANTEYISEFDIPNGALVRIPFPLSKAKSDYQDLLTKYKNL